MSMITYDGHRHEAPGSLPAGSLLRRLAAVLRLNDETTARLMIVLGSLLVFASLYAASAVLMSPGYVVVGETMIVQGGGLVTVVEGRY